MIALMLVSLQKGIAVSPAVGTTLASIKTATAGMHSGMLNMSLQAWFLSTAAESKCNSGLFSADLQTRMFSDFRSLWKLSAAML